MTTNKTEITLIAEAIIANTRLIEMLINKLPDPVREAVATILTEKNANPTPVLTITQPAPAAVVPAAPVIKAPVPAPAPVPAMPAAPVFAPVQVPVPVAAQQEVALAFANKQAMMDFVISSYKLLGSEKGAAIQGVLTGMGVNNINDVDPARWGELKAGIDALKG